MEDFLKFKRMITPIIIQILFWIGVVLCVIGGLVRSRRESAPSTAEVSLGRFAPVSPRSTGGPNQVRAPDRAVQHQRHADRHQQQDARHDRVSEDVGYLVSGKQSVGGVSRRRLYVPSTQSASGDASYNRQFSDTLT